MWSRKRAAPRVAPGFLIFLLVALTADAACGFVGPSLSPSPAPVLAVNRLPRPHYVWFGGPSEVGFEIAPGSTTTIRLPFSVDLVRLAVALDSECRALFTVSFGGDAQGLDRGGVFTFDAEGSGFGAPNADSSAADAPETDRCRLPALSVLSGGA